MKMVNILGEECKMFDDKEKSMQVLVGYVKDTGIPAKLVVA